MFQFQHNFPQQNPIDNEQHHQPMSNMTGYINPDVNGAFKRVSYQDISHADRSVSFITHSMFAT